MSEVRPITQNFARPSYRPQEKSGLDPEVRRMLLMAVAVGGVLVLLVGGVSFTWRQPHGVPVIGPPDKPVRVKPADPGGMQVAGADDFGSTGAERLAPPPEKPAIRALRARKIEHEPGHATAVVPVTPAEPAVVAAPSPAAAPAQGGVAVQLAAFESAQAAQQDWGRLSERMPKLFKSHTPMVERAELVGRTVYRLRTGGFASLAAANAFCAELRAGGEDCSIAAF